MNEIHLTTLKCERCGHAWIPRKPEKPQTCPKCRSPYWHTKRWKGVSDRNQQQFGILWRILRRLAEHCEIAIQPTRCILEPTKKGTAYHFRIPNNRSRRQVIAWAGLMPNGSEKFGTSKPCVIVAVWALPLDVTRPPFSGYFHPNANWGVKGQGEVQAAICDVNDVNYRVILRALTEAALAL